MTSADNYYPQKQFNNNFVPYYSINASTTFYHFFITIAVTLILISNSPSSSFVNSTTPPSIFCKRPCVNELISLYRAVEDGTGAVAFWIHGKRLEYECIKGYSPTTDFGVVSCSDAGNASFSGTCAPNICSRRETAATIETMTSLRGEPQDLLTHNADLIYQCKPGYVESASYRIGTVTCLVPNGVATFSGACTPKVCSELGDERRIESLMPLSGVSIHLRTHGASVVYRCKSGYVERMAAAGGNKIGRIRCVDGKRARFTGASCVPRVCMHGPKDPSIEVLEPAEDDDDNYIDDFEQNSYDNNNNNGESASGIMNNNDEEANYYYEQEHGSVKLRTHGKIAVYRCKAGYSEMDENMLGRISCLNGVVATFSGKCIRNSNYNHHHHLDDTHPMMMNPKASAIDII